MLLHAEFFYYTRIEYIFGKYLEILDPRLVLTLALAVLRIHHTYASKSQSFSCLFPSIYFYKSPPHSMIYSTAMGINIAYYRARQQLEEHSFSYQKAERFCSAFHVRYQTWLMGRNLVYAALFEFECANGGAIGST